MASRGFLARRPKKTNTSITGTGKTHRRRKVPPWDNSISNLLVYKSTEEELRRRHELHQPIRRELETDEDEPFLLGIVDHDEVVPGTPNVNDMSDTITDFHEKLQNALTYSDKRLSAVRDMFGDDPKKFRGFPNVTSAPIAQRARHATQHKTLSSPALIKEVSLGSSHLDILSDTVMDETALNDLDEYNSNTKEQLIHGRGNNGHVRDNPGNDDQGKEVHFKNSADEKGQKTLSTPPSIVETGALIEQSPTVARGVDSSAGHQYSKNRVNSNRKINVDEDDEKRSTPGNSSNVSGKGLHDLRQMLNDLEEEVRMYEQETGREKFSSPPRLKEQNSFGGFTVTVLNAVTKLVKYLRENETKRKTDAKIEEELLLGFEEQHILINSLTNDIMYVREENGRLKVRLEACENEIKNLKNKNYCSTKNECAGAVDELRHQQIAQSSNNESDKEVLVEPPRDDTLADDENIHCSNISRKLFGAGLSEITDDLRAVSNISNMSKDPRPQRGIQIHNYKESKATAAVGDSVKNGVAMNKILDYGNDIVSRSGENNISPALSSQDGISIGNNAVTSPSSPTFTGNTSENKMSTQQATPPSPHYNTREDVFLSNTPNNDNINGITQSVFLGRNHTMSPHRKPKTTDKAGAQGKVITSFSNYQDLINEQGNSGINQYPGNGLRKKHFSIVGHIPAEKDEELSPVSHDSRQGGIKTVKNDKIVVTLPSMWQDAESKPRKGISREGTFTLTRKYDVNNNEREV